MTTIIILVLLHIISTIMIVIFVFANQLLLSTNVLFVILINSQGVLLIGGLGSISTTELVTGWMLD